jgi:uncharacterized protein (TIGR02117 family)
MQKPIFIALKFLKKLLLAFFSLVLFYLAAIVVCGLWPVNRSFAQSPENYEIVVMDNGVHTDLALPVKTSVIDWNQYLFLKDYKGANAGFTHFAFGWGNRKFYMETPEWRDLDLDVALSAAFGFGKSAMHVYYLRAAPKASKKNVVLKLSETQYRQLVTYILHTFQQENGSFLLIKGKGYTSTDNFYEANGSFSLLKTCNSWTNSGLKAAGIKTVFWAPLPHLMMRKLRKLNAGNPQ